MSTPATTPAEINLAVLMQSALRSRQFVLEAAIALLMGIDRDRWERCRGRPFSRPERQQRRTVEAQKPIPVVVSTTPNHQPKKTKRKRQRKRRTRKPRGHHEIDMEVNTSTPDDSSEQPTPVQPRQSPALLQQSTPSGEPTSEKPCQPATREVGLQQCTPTGEPREEEPRQPARGEVCLQQTTPTGDPAEGKPGKPASEEGSPLQDSSGASHSDDAAQDSDSTGSESSDDADSDSDSVMDVCPQQPVKPVGNAVRPVPCDPENLYEPYSEGKPCPWELVPNLKRSLRKGRNGENHLWEDTQFPDYVFHKAMEWFPESYKLYITRRELDPSTGPSAYIVLTKEERMALRDSPPSSQTSP